MDDMEFGTNNVNCNCNIACDRITKLKPPIVLSNQL